MNVWITRTLFICCIATVVSGCKIAVLTSSGGDIRSSSGGMVCAGPSFCEFDINTHQLPFAESFTAIPREGYAFEKWADGSGFFCGKSTDPTCTVNIPDNAFGALLVALFDSGYIMPIFKDVGFDWDSDGIRNEIDEDDDNDGFLDADDDCPQDPDPSCELETVFMDGKDWAQVDRFLNGSWVAINAVCAGGPCSDGALVNGYDMTGWSWASSSELFELLGSYADEPWEYPYREANSVWAPAFFADGMRPLWEGNNNAGSMYREVGGSISSGWCDPYDSDILSVIDVLYSELGEDYITVNNMACTSEQTGRGAWFYRIP